MGPGQALRPVSFAVINPDHGVRPYIVCALFNLVEWEYRIEIRVPLCSRPIRLIPNIQRSWVRFPRMRRFKVTEERPLPVTLCLLVVPLYLELEFPVSLPRFCELEFCFSMTKNTPEKENPEEQEQEAPRKKKEKNN